MVTPWTKLKRARPLFPELSPSPSPPPPPPLPRKKIHEPPPSTSKAANVARGHEPRESSSPDIQIIEKPATIGLYPKHKGKGREREGSKAKMKSEKAGKKTRSSEVIEIDSGSDTMPLRKRRKTDGGGPSGSQQTRTQSGKKAMDRPHKDLGQSQSQSKKGKVKPPVKLIDSSSEPTSAAVAAPQTKAKLLADDVSCEWPEIIQGDSVYKHEVSSRGFGVACIVADVYCRWRQFVNCDK